jgi:hypothetical protein
MLMRELSMFLLCDVIQERSLDCESWGITTCSHKVRNIIMYSSYMLQLPVKITHRSLRRYDGCVVQLRFMSARSAETDRDKYSNEKVNAMVGHNFPDFIEKWNRSTFKVVGNGLIAATALCAVGGVATATTVTMTSMMPSVVLFALTTGYWHVGSNDINQTSHAIRRNFPVIGNLRYVLEMVRNVA